MSKPIRVIKAFNDKPNFFIFHAELIAPFAIITTFAFVGCYILLALSMKVFVAIDLWLCGTWWILAGNKSYQFTDRLFLLPGNAYFNLNTMFVPATDSGSFKRKMKAKIAPQIIKNNQGKKQKVVPFQIESDLHTIMEIDFNDDRFALLLKCDKNGNWSSTIPLVLEGLHTNLFDSEITDYSAAISDALKDIPPGESLSLKIGCFSQTRSRTQALNELSDNNKLPFIELMLESERLRVKDITAKGFRQEWEQYAFLSWHQNKQDERKNNDLLSKFMISVGKMFNRQKEAFAGTRLSNLRNIYIQLAQEIYENSYISWKDTLGTKAKLGFRPMTASEIWENLLWYKFNQSEPPPIPQLIKVQRLGNKYNSQIKVFNRKRPKDIISVLIGGEKGKSSCPQHLERRDVVFLNGKYIACMILEEAPEQWADSRNQLEWIWSKIGNSSVRDTELIIEISNGDKDLAQSRLVKISKQSNTSNAHAIKDGEGINVAATFKQQEAIEAQARLHQGARPLYGAMILLIYRDNLEQLDRACNRLANSFSPAKLIREENICWKIWSESLIFNDKELLKSTAIFSERRSILDSISMRGLLPLQKPLDVHSSGMELLDEQGGYPLHLNLFKNNERAIVTGKSGSGKSVLSFGIIKHALALGIKVVGIDMSNAGQSTFQLVTDLLKDKGAYINITECSYNLLQPPDIRKYDPKQQEKRRKIWENALRSMLLSLAMGQIENAELRERVDSILLKLLNKFLGNEEIVERYNEAFDFGWQSVQWQNMPVLEDLLFFCSREKLGLQDYKEIDERAINQINNQIGAKLVDPNIGKAISRPSNIPPLPDMSFFALSGLSNETNSFVMALVAQMACLNVALENPQSLFVMDECSVLLGKRGFSQVVGERFATGRKEGMSVLLIGQDLESIAKCPDREKIITNTDYYLIGKTSNGATKTYTELIGVLPKVISRNASKSFSANKQYFYSNWLLYQDDRYWFCRYFTPLIELAALANSPEEKEMKNYFFSQYPDTYIGTLKGLAAYSRSMLQGFSSKKSHRKNKQNFQKIA